MRTHFIRTAATLIALCSLACAGASVRPDARPASASMSDTKPPVAPTRAYEHRYHGEAIADPWHWLKNKKDPRVRAYLQAENTYTAAYEKRLAPLKKAIYDEFIVLLQPARRSRGARASGCTTAARSRAGATGCTAAASPARPRSGRRPPSR